MNKRECVCVKERERECVFEREREKERGSVSEWERGSERVCVCDSFVRRKKKAGSLSPKSRTGKIRFLALSVKWSPSTL